MLAKIWDQHVIARISDDTDLLHIDRHLLHDLGGSRGLLDLKSRNLQVHNPELTFATPDHAISTAHGRAGTSKTGWELLEGLRAETSASGITMFDVDQPGQGIVHVIGPELGLSLPGCLIVCGDSHTCTHGGLGALAFGIGSSELTHVLATQALIQRRPKTMRVKFEGRMSAGVTPKDLILALIGHVGAAGGTGYAVEYAGSAIREMGIEGRLTICNLSIELGAKMGMVAPDEKTFEFVRGRRYAPQGAMWERAVAAWRQLPSDANAVFDREVTIDVAKIIPQITWGISPEHVIGVDGHVPSSCRNQRSRAPRRDRNRDRLHGPQTRRADHGHTRRLGFYRLLHQQPLERFARGGRHCPWPQSRARRARLGGAGFGNDQAGGRRRRAGQALHGGRLRMARAGLLDVPCREWRGGSAGSAFGLDLQPQFHRPARAARPHPSGKSRDGGGRGNLWCDRRCADLGAVDLER